MRTAVYLQFDESNNANYIYVPEICRHDNTWEMLETAFPTNGHALAYFKPQISGDWEQTEMGWIGALKKKSAFGKIAHTIRIRQLIVSTYEGPNEEALATVSDNLFHRCSG